MGDKITLKVYSVDGKTYIDDVDFVYVDVPDYGVRGLTPGHTPFSALLFIGSFYYVKDDKKTYVTISGGNINFKNNVATILADTFEKEDELDKVRIMAAKEKAEEILANPQNTDKKAYEDAQFSLKKAMNRIKHLK